MIHFMRNGEKDCETVWVRVDLKDVCVEEPRVWFSMKCDSPIYAVLLLQQLERQYHDAVTATQAKAYEQGYKDGRGRKRKEKWFPGFLKV